MEARTTLTDKQWALIESVLPYRCTDVAPQPTRPFSLGIRSRPLPELQKRRPDARSRSSSSHRELRPRPTVSCTTSAAPHREWRRPLAPPTASRSCAPPEKSVLPDTPTPVGEVPTGETSPQCTHEFPQSPRPTSKTSSLSVAIASPHPLPEVPPCYQDLSATVVLEALTQHGPYDPLSAL